MTVIAGYLGAGKTTLINRLLAGAGGRKLLVMVNDFGAINIDADLLASRNEDTIALTNGCVCCTMGADLFMAIGDVLDRQTRPDHLIIEASGVSDPARIANVALAEPDLQYAGIVTVVDGSTIEDLYQDPLIGPQVKHQVTRADLVWASKDPSVEQLSFLRRVASAPVVSEGSPDALLGLVATDTVPPSADIGEDHADYVSWSADGIILQDIDTLRAALRNRPTGLFRVKGTVRDGTNTCWRVQVVGRQVDLTQVAGDPKTALVGIGLKSQVVLKDIQRWWGHLGAEGKGVTEKS